MHKVYMKVAPTRIVEMFHIVDRTRPRRDPEYFSTPYNRLRKTDNSIIYKGPRLYNRIVHEINSTLPDKVPRLQNNFMDPFKANIAKYLLNVQKANNKDDTWQMENFVLYSD